MANEQANNQERIQISGFSQLVPIFNGDDRPKVEAFLDVVQSTKEMANWTDAITIAVVRSKFRGAAADFWQESAELRSKTTYKEFSEILLNHFKPKTKMEIKITQFVDVVQKDKEKVKDYATRLKAKARELFGDDPSDNETAMIMAQFMKGLNLKLRRLVMTRDPDDLEEAIEVAEAEELNEELLRKSEKAQATVETNESKEIEYSQLQKRICALEKQLKEERKGQASNFQNKGQYSTQNKNRYFDTGAKPKQFNSQGYRKGNVQVNQGEKPRSFQQDIPPRFQKSNKEFKERFQGNRNATQKQTTPFICFHCQEKGHIRSNCPKLKNVQANFTEMKPLN